MVHNGEFSKIALKKLKLLNGCTARWMRGKAGKALQQRFFFILTFQRPEYNSLKKIWLPQKGGTIPPLPPLQTPSYCSFFKN
jgi:hypothetical protein